MLVWADLSFGNPSQKPRKHFAQPLVAAVLSEQDWQKNGQQQRCNNCPYHKPNPSRSQLLRAERVEDIAIGTEFSLNIIFVIELGVIQIRLGFTPPVCFARAAVRAGPPRCRDVCSTVGASKSAH